MATNGKIKQGKVLTAIVGSYPKPKYLFSKSGRKLLDSLGLEFKAAKKDMEKASLQAIKDQDQIGLDIITDGEEKRGHYVLDILKKLDGFNFKKLKRISYRGGILQRDVPTVTGPIKYKGEIVLDEYRFNKKFGEGEIKVGLPGPSTVVDCVADEYYKGNLEKLAFDYAKAIRHEVKALIDIGCKVIQFDDPVLLRFPDRAKKWGLKALEECFKGLENKATFIVHICCGYPNKPLEEKGISYKANKDYYKDVLKWFSKSKLDGVSIEGAQSKLDLSVLSSIGKKKVMLGVLDVGVNKVETAEALYRRGKEALKYIRADQLILGPDCGMIELSRASAKGKLKNMALAAERLNKGV